MMSVTRMQQVMSLMLAGLALAWLGVWASRVQWALAALALLAAVPHAPVLAFEFFWASRLARHPSARRAQGCEGAPAQDQPDRTTWFAAFGRETLLGIQVFGWQQPWAHDALADHLPADGRGRRGVLLVHGYFCNRGFWNPWMARLRAAGVPFVAVSLPQPMADIADQARGLEQARLRLLQATGVTPLLVGHSMGGLLIRSWLAQHSDALALQHEVITIGSPHHGTVLARLGLSTAALQMRPGSDFLRELARRENPQRLARLSCYWSVCDNIVFPASQATLAGARNIALHGLPHVGLAYAPQIFEDVLGRLNGRESPAGRS
jgi:triacylglycerol esterase/lipase EstA (alpha/beta hydrolase family)